MQEDKYNVTKVTFHAQNEEQYIKYINSLKKSIFVYFRDNVNE